MIYQTQNFEFVKRLCPYTSHNYDERIGFDTIQLYYTCDNEEYVHVLYLG